MRCSAEQTSAALTEAEQHVCKRGEKKKKKPTDKRKKGRITKQFEIIETLIKRLDNPIIKYDFCKNGEAKNLLKKKLQIKSRILSLRSYDALTIKKKKIKKAKKSRYNAEVEEKAEKEEKEEKRAGKNWPLYHMENIR
ncbi:hypothetical protein POVCU2_0037070 [Plasmodium ovale curtisi]|uniref:Uncharacterized protein n=1 Tax=Plasmodium ovale curtisi TaxID=864141 RepID=A0A1A8W428_PLAOA|nr:hypothetical protein POVCU2_0037070 [Plasmodium ovale curtisi]